MATSISHMEGLSKKPAGTRPLFDIVLKVGLPIAYILFPSMYFAALL